MTHTMIPGPITSWSKSLLRYKSKPKVMDVVAADRTSLMKEKGLICAKEKGLLVVGRVVSNLGAFLDCWALHLFVESGVPSFLSVILLLGAPFQFTQACYIYQFVVVISS
jgi:hypothetical protein